MEDKLLSNIMNFIRDSSIDKDENYLFDIPPSRWYDSTHSLPGSLAAIVESYEFIDSSKYKNWKNPFDKVWWL